MNRSRLLKYVLSGVLTWILIGAFFNFLFPMILNSSLLFGGLVALLLVGGLVMIVLTAREMLRR